MRDALDLMTFLPRNSYSLSGGAAGTPKNMLQRRAGHAELSRELYCGMAGVRWGRDHRTVGQGTTRMAGENWRSAAAAIAGKGSRVCHRLQGQRRAGEEGAR